MTDGITSFLVKGTGARELRSALRLKTRRLGAVLQAMGKMKTVRSELPRSVLGTDLLELLSKRMRQLLQNDEEAPSAVASIVRRGSRFFEQGGVLGSSEPAFSVLPKREGLRSIFDALPPDLQGRDSILPLATLHSAVAGAVSFPPRQVQPDSHANWQPTEGTADISRDSFPQNKSSVTDRRRQNETVRSLLAIKLQEYWELSRQQQPVDKGSDPIAARRATNEATNAPQSAWRPIAQAPRSWPEITGQQVARRLRSISPGGSSSHAMQTVKSSSPDRIEIENIFNIEVKAAGGSDIGFAEELPDKIANILREQALQHGIDIT